MLRCSISALSLHASRLILRTRRYKNLVRDFDKEREKTALLLQDLARDHAVLVVEHDMEFVRQTAHRVTVLHEGHILCEGSVEHVQRDPRVVEVYLGRG